MVEFRFILIGIVSALVIIVSIILVKYRNLLRVGNIEMNKEEVLGRMFLRKIRKLGEPKSGENVRDYLKSLNEIMRDFFRELYDISYEFAYIELNEELVKKGVDEKVRNEIIEFTMHMAESEYGKGGVTEQEFYYLLGQSIKIIERVTGSRNVEVSKEVLERVPESKPESLKKKMEAPPVISAPVPPAKKLEEPTPTELEMEKELLIPKTAEEKIEKIRRILNSAENNIRDKKPKDAMQDYTNLRTIYDSLGRGMKMKINAETKRIISLYNSLLSEYKEILKS